MLLDNGWKDALSDEFKKPYMRELSRFISEERKHGRVFPPQDEVFNAFNHTPFEQVRVVIVGQDPYHGPGQAHGLCFSVSGNVKLPPSLKNIFKELHADLGVPIPTHGNLLKWAKEGVLLLNTSLTVRQAEPMSHAGRGWEQFTDKVIQVLAERKDPIVFMLWGKAAKDKCDRLLAHHKQHLVLVAAHPSPYSAAGFLGCRHFSKANEFLKNHNKKPIAWDL